MNYDPTHLKRLWDFFGPYPCMEIIVYNSRFNSNRRLEKTESNYKITHAGWFDQLSAIESVCRRLSGVSAYLTINPVNPDLMSRCKNDLIRVKSNDDHIPPATHCSDILYFQHILIDIDYERAKGTSSSSAELESTIDIRDRILAENPIIHQSSIWGISGNGSYILTSLSTPLPNTDRNKQRISEFLKSLAVRYGEKGKAKVHIDDQVYFPSVHIGIPGTMKCKGSHTDERPHRVITVDGGFYGHKCMASGVNSGARP